MNEADQAVFLSYASQDAEAARRICDALRQAGVEVWFDQNELRGGDAWDQKIRQQIQACALLIPIISENTQARREGYFRLEWRLAAQRTHLMSESLPFLLPVVIDATSEAAADVPGEFRAVQWTRLRPAGRGYGGQARPAGASSGAQTRPEDDDPALARFVERVQQLLAAETVDVRPKERGGAIPAAPERATSPLSGRKYPGWIWALPAILLGGFGVAYLARRESAPPPAATVPPAAGAPAAVVPEHSIAVLPFENRSEGAENAYIADGIHEDVVTNLAGISELKVTSRASALRYRSTPKPVREIAEELGVAYVLTGSLRREGSAVRVTAQLVDARTDRQVWAKSFDRELTRVLALQSELAGEIVPALRVVLRPGEAERLATGTTAIGSAYEHYLQARALLHFGQYPAGKVADDAEALLRQAVAVDPQFVRAWVELSRLHVDVYLGGAEYKTPARIAAAEEAVAAAQKLAPRAPEVRLAAGRIRHYCYQDYTGAMRAYRDLLAGHPNYPDVRIVLALLERRLGNWPEALRGLREARRQEPGNLSTRGMLAMTAIWTRRYAEADAIFALPVPEGIQDQPGFVLERSNAEFRRSGSRETFENWYAGLTAGKRDSAPVVRVALGWSILSGDERRIREIAAKHGLDLESIDAAIVPLHAGQPEIARAWLAPLQPQIDRMLQLTAQDDSPWRTIAKYRALQGDRAGAREAAARARERLSEASDAVNGVMTSVECAKVLAWIGDHAAALTELERLIKLPASVHVWNLKHTVAWLPLRNEPRLQALISDPANLLPLVPDP